MPGGSHGATLAQGLAFGGGGRIVKVGERYLLVWLRQDDGSWKIAYDVWHGQAE